VLGITWVTGDEWPETLHHFGYRLQILRLAWITLSDVSAELLKALIFHPDLSLIKEQQQRWGTFCQIN
jgi:uncharacterized metal-binding protein